MPIPRIYQAHALKPKLSFCLDEKASHHVASVIRAKVGDGLTIFNGLGGEYTAIITDIRKKKVAVDVITFLAEELESPLDIYLAQSLLRGEKMDFIVQKAVELGVKKILPILTERCNLKLNPERALKRLNHWRSIIISACEQCGRNRLPEISPPISFRECLVKADANQRFLLSPRASNKFVIQNLTKQKSVLLMIGPEGGLTNHEIELAMSQGFHPFNLGPRILRTETATISAISILQHTYGDL